MNLLEKCNNCKLKECVECEYTWSDLKETIEHLQRENIMLNNIANNCPHYNTSGISCDKKFCNLDDYISKDKIREKIEEIKSRMNDDCLALHEFQREAKIDVLYDLLKEE